MDPSRPIDALQGMRERIVRVELKNGRVFTGKLKSYDIHLNTVLYGASCDDVKYGTVFFRGDAIVLINPED